MNRSLSQSLVALLCSIFCLLLVSGPALAKEKPVILTPPSLMEESGDVATELRLTIAKLMENSSQSQKQLESLEKLMSSPVGTKLVIVGDARASALRKNKSAPKFGKIAGAEQLDIEDVIEWGDNSLDQLEAIQESMKDELDSNSDLSEEMSLRMQIYMDRVAKIHKTLSNLMKKLSDTQSQIIGNMK